MSLHARTKRKHDALLAFSTFLFLFLLIFQALALAVITLKWLPLPLYETTVARLLQVGAWFPTPPSLPSFSQAVSNVIAFPLPLYLLFPPLLFPPQ